MTAVAVVAALALTGCTTGAAATPDRPDRPNVVFVLTDDLSWNLVRYMPHVLAMQKAGVTLSNHFVVDSLCCPSRSAILTGEYPHDNGVFTNGGSDGGYSTFNRHGNPQNTFGVAMHKAGYRTGFMGKYLNGYLPSDEPPPGWDEWDVAGNGYPEFGYQLNENGTTHRYGKDPEDYLTDVLSDKAMSFVDHSSSGSSPFMLELATFAPHKPSTPAPRDADTFADLTAPRSPAYGTRPSDAPSWLADIPPLSPRDSRRIDHDFRRRVQSVQAVDDMIGRLQQHLRDQGMAKDTYFVFSSDNGFHMGEYNLRSGKQTAFDTDIRVPLMVTGPGVPAGRRVTRLSSSIDLAPTFEELAGATVPPPCDGTSLLRLWHGQSPGRWQQAILVEHHGPDRTPHDPDKPGRAGGDPPTYEAVRTADALYVRYANGQREYYDTTADPYEVRNLASSAPDGRTAPLRDALSALVNCHGRDSCQAAAQLH
ncbi:MAG: sulfatase [Actinocatenispora sp.]